MGSNAGAVIGGVAGSFFGGPVGAAAGAGLGSMLLDQPRAAGELASAQGQAAQAQLAEERRMRAEAAAAAEPSPMELQQMQQAISLNEQEISRRQKLIDSADPSLIEAGHQALQMMQGEEAKILDPIRRQRAREKQVLASTLQQRLGAGWETSTAGIQAMAAHDEATNSVLAQAQDQSLGRLLGVSQDTAARYGQSETGGRALQIAQTRGNVNTRIANALTGNRIENASAPFVADVSRAGSQMQQTAGIAQAGLTLAGMGLNAGKGPTTVNNITLGDYGGYGGGGYGQPRPIP